MKYSKVVLKEIIKYMEEGASNKDAATLAGIGESTFYDWQQEKLPDGKPNPSYFVEFVESIKKAELKRKKALINKIIAKDNSWQAAAWYLERQYPDEFKERRQYDITAVSPQEKIKKTMELIEEETKDVQTGEVIDEQVSTDGGDALQEQGGEAVSTDEGTE